MLIYCLSAVCASEINATSQDLTEIDDTNIKFSSLDTELSSVDEISENVKLSATDDSKDNLTSNEKTDTPNINGPKIPDSGIDIHPPKIPLKNPTIDITGPKAGEHFLYNLGRISLSADVVNLKIENSKDLDDLSKYISDKNPSWGLLNITLAPNSEFKVNNDGFRDYECSYKFRYWGTMIINGQGSTITGSKNFMYLTQNANVILNNVKFSGFDTVFFNFGHVYCYTTIFNTNNNVITNYNSAGFESCHFSNRDANYIEAKEGSFNVLYDCMYCLGEKECIKCEKNSIMTIYSPIYFNMLKNCRIDPAACFSMISTKQSKNDTVIINCGDIDQFKNTLSTLNSFTPNVGRIEINLKSGIYELSRDDIKNINKNSLKSMSNAPASLLVGEIPIIINGNSTVIRYTGANVKNSPYTIKTKEGDIKWDNYKHERFANIAH